MRYLCCKTSVLLQPDIGEMLDGDGRRGSHEDFTISAPGDLLGPNLVNVDLTCLTSPFPPAQTFKVLLNLTIGLC